MAAQPAQGQQVRRGNPDRHRPQEPRAIMRTAFKASEDAEDQATMDILVGRMKESDRVAWMLRSHLEKASSEMLPRAVAEAAE